MHVSLHVFSFLGMVVSLICTHNALIVTWRSRSATRIRQLCMSSSLESFCVALLNLRCVAGYTKSQQYCMPWLLHLSIQIQPCTLCCPVGQDPREVTASKPHSRRACVPQPSVILSPRSIPYAHPSSLLDKVCTFVRHHFKAEQKQSTSFWSLFHSLNPSSLPPVEPTNHPTLDSSGARRHSGSPTGLRLI